MDELFLNTNDSDLLRQALRLIGARDAVLLLVSPSFHVSALTPAAKKLLGLSVLDSFSELLDPKTLSALRLCLQTGADTSLTETIDGVHYRMDAAVTGENLLIALSPADMPLMQPSALEQFFAHRMRGALSSILLANRSLATAQEDDRRAELHRMIDQNSLYMQRTLAHADTLLEPALTPNLAKDDLAALCREIGARCQQAAGEHLQILLKVPESFPAVFDQKLLTGALYNLMTNAMNASGVTTVTLGLSQSGKHIMLHVIDDGDGLSPSRLPQLYRGWRGTQTAEQLLDDAVQSRSWGLGLPLCQHIAGLHGGTLLMQPGDEGGCVFTLMFPGDLAPHHMLGQPPLVLSDGYDLAEVELSAFRPREKGGLF